MPRSHPRSYRDYDPHYSPAIVRHRTGGDVLSEIERHRHRTGWKGPVILVPA